MGQEGHKAVLQEYGVYEDPRMQALLDSVGQALAKQSHLPQLEWHFTLLDDPTVNAFAMPGGYIYVTRGIMAHLSSEAQLAGVLGHEIGHVVARHSAAQMAKAKLTQGLTGAAVLATYDPNDPSTQRNAAVAAMIGNLVNMKFGRDDELQADNLGVRFLAEAGYDPRAMLTVMDILKQASGGARQPEFFSTHPNPENRAERIQAAIGALFPQGVPDGLQG